MIEGIHKLKNGRQYKVLKCDTEYATNPEGDYATGGYHITSWEPSFDNDKGGKGLWVYISNAPDKASVEAFLKAAERLAPLNR
jgi:hypothetical protein